MLIFYLILGLFAIALIFSLVQMKKGATWAKPAIPVMVIVAILTTIVTMFLQTREPAYHRDYGVYKIIGRELAKSFGKHLSAGGKVIIFIPYNPEAISPDLRHKYYMEGFLSGFSSQNIFIAKVISLPKKYYGAQLQEFYNDKLAENAGIVGWISLGKRPPQLDKLRVFSTANPPKIALIIAMNPEISSFIEAGLVQTVIAGTPEVQVVKKGKKIPPEKLFETRYMVVTPE